MEIRWKRRASKFMGKKCVCGERQARNDDREKNESYASDNNFACDRPRLPIGNFYLRFAEQMGGSTMELDLYNGLVLGNITTTNGQLSFVMLASSRYDLADVITIQYWGSGVEFSWSWVPEDAQSSWGVTGNCGNYTLNPPPIMSVVEGMNLTTQMHLSGRSHAVAFLDVPQSDGSGVIYATVSNVSWDSPSVAVATVQQALLLPYSDLVNMHQAWWNSYYPASFMSFTDSILESFYWINMYKLASGTRPDRVVYDLMGPWYIDGTMWPDLHWDLNVQLTYWPFFTSNRVEFSQSLTSLLDANINNLMQNVLPEFSADSSAAPVGASALDLLQTCYWVYGEDCLTTPPAITGNLLWTLQLYYQAYQFTMNETVLEGLFPLLRLAVNFYTHWQLDNSTDHLIHLPPTFSPEYAVAPDCNYDLALYRWGLTTVLDLALNILHIDDPNIGLWNDTLNRLTAYPVGPDGFMIGAGVPLSSSHRHFSHLMMIFPLRTLNFSDPAALDLSMISVDHWLSMPSALTGFCRTAASSMNVMFGRQEAAYTNLTLLIDNYIQPNTFYEEGTNGECGETPPAASSAMMDWMVMSWNSVMHFFQGIDDNVLTDASFYNLRQPGAFLTAGKRISGVTQFIQITSEYGSPCFFSTDMAAPLSTYPSDITIVPQGDNVYLAVLSPGETVLIFSEASPPENVSITSSPGTPKNFNYWGYPLGGAATDPVFLSPCQGLASQQFVWDPTIPNSLVYYGPSLNSSSPLCLAVSDCLGENGASIVIVPCSSSSCAGSSNMLWTLAADTTLSVATSGRCLDVNGAMGPTLDLWDCNPQAQYRNTEWMYNATDASLRSLDDDPSFTAGSCLTVLPQYLSHF